MAALALPPHPSTGHHVLSAARPSITVSTPTLTCTNTSQTIKVYSIGWMPLPWVLLPGHTTALCFQCSACQSTRGGCWQPCLLPDPFSQRPTAHPDRGRCRACAAPAAQGPCPGLRGTISILLCPVHCPHLEPWGPGTRRRPHSASEAMQSQVCRCGRCTLCPLPWLRDKCSC